MIFVETPVFTKRITTILSHEEYREVQLDLIVKPDKGALIKGSKGLRKLRCKASGRGKRGGARIIYYWIKDKDRVYFLLAYQKNGAENLSKDEINKLSQLIEEELS